jgi:prepilin-type N-terminal cleavage/methylation domain-containing protein
MQKGFTVIEIVIVIALIGIVTAVSAPFLSDALTRKDLDSYAAEAMDGLREAQSSVMSGRNNARFGVHFEAAKFVFFQGAAYNPVDTDNVIHALAGDATITSVTLSPGGACVVATGSGNCDVHYINHRGTPTESGTIVFTGDGGQLKTVTVGAAGMLDLD